MAYTRYDKILLLIENNSIEDFYFSSAYRAPTYFLEILNSTV